MTFARKIFLSLILISFTASCIISSVLYCLLKGDLSKEFYERYSSYGSTIASTFNYLEIASDLANKNAVYFLSKVVSEKGIPSDAALDALAKKLGVNGFYIINKDGKFIRSSDIPIKRQTNLLFSYSFGYRKLLTGELGVATTPIIPSYPYDIPAKLTMISSKDRALILESSTHLEYISKILSQIISNDKNIVAVGLYAPTGYELGSVSVNGKFHQGRRGALNKEKMAKNLFIFSVKIPTVSGNCPECLNKGVSIDGHYYYLLRMEISLTPFYERLHRIKIQLALVFLMILIGSVVISRYISNKLVSRIDKINKVVQDVLVNNDLNQQVSISGSDEISNLGNTFNKMILSLKESREVLIENQHIESAARISAQLAHDIRSPLAVIHMLIKDVNNIPEASRVMLCNATQRISDIANNFLYQYKRPGETNQLSQLSEEHIPSLLESIVSEKSRQYSTRDIVINLSVEPEAWNIFANINPMDFKRIISNLINNSIEAINDSGVIDVVLSRINKSLRISISDNGCGISADFLPEILLGGVSFGKANGSGLGLSHAIEKVSDWNGDFNIESDVGIGTKINIDLPFNINIPAWFQQPIVLQPNSHVVIVDNEPYVHDVWKKILTNYESNFSVKYLSSIYELKDLLSQNTSMNVIYFIDYDFGLNQLNGLEIIKLFSISDRSTLVTNRYDDCEVKKNACALGVKIIPKISMQYFPIVISSKVDNKKSYDSL